MHYDDFTLHHRTANGMSPRPVQVGDPKLDSYSARAFAEVDAACTAWLKKRGLLYANPESGMAYAQAAETNRKRFAKLRKGGGR